MMGFIPTDTGLEVSELETDASFAQRTIRRRHGDVGMEGLRRLAYAFVEEPDTILQELTDAAVDLCGADSAGISVETPGDAGAVFYQWVATSGQYARFKDARLPFAPSACTICLMRNSPQVLRVSKVFFDLLGVDAEPVTDGILLPWQHGKTRGTIFILAHGRTEAFDSDDLRLMQALASFAAMGVRQQQQQRLLVQRKSAEAATAMAADLAHYINNPLQSLTNLLYLATDGNAGMDGKTLAIELSGHVERISSLVREVLTLPQYSQY